jgi:quercetin dioxygenase-like cupin family protein
MEQQGRTLIAATLAASLAASTLIAAPARATPSSGFTGTQISRGLFGELNLNADKSGTWDLKLKTKANSDVYVTRNAIAVGGQSGWHTHPGPSLITVTVGAITVYEGDNPACAPTVYRAGEQGSIDIGSGHSHLIRNESGAPAETVAVQFVPAGADRRIDMPKPTNCEF